MNSVKLTESQPSAFALLVDKLRTKSDAELKLLYVRFFQNELKKEWKSVTKKADFSNTSDEDIVKAIQKNRYGK